jgi:hypothetical protein
LVHTIRKRRKRKRKRKEEEGGQEFHAKDAEKKLNHTSLRVEIQRMWHMKRMIVPVIYGATRIVKKCLKKDPKPYQENRIINIFTTKDSYTRNIKHNTEGPAV